MKLNYRIYICILIFRFSIINNIAFCQEPSIDSGIFRNCVPALDKIDSQFVYSTTDNATLGHFKGGEEELLKYINAHVRFSASEPEWHGKVLVTFIIDTTGAIRNICILKHIPNSVEIEVYKLLLGMPNWIPGEINGKKVCTRYILPIIFDP